MKKIFFTLYMLTFVMSFEFAKAQEITITLDAATNVTCNGGSNGAITVTAVENNPYYSINGYYWSNGANTQNISNLAAGTYTLTVTDTWNESNTFSHTISQPDAFAATFITVGDTGTINHYGKAVPEVTGGTPPYSYLWSTTATTDSITGLTNGNYSVTVTDSKNCVSNEFDFVVGLALGIQEVGNSINQLTIYPNPATDYLFVSENSSYLKEIEVDDILGHSIIQKPVTQQQTIMDVSHLAAGIYFTLLKSENGSTEVRKFMKE